MANFQLGDTEQVAFTLTELDADSNPATAKSDDVITVVSSDTDSATVVMDPTPAANSVASGVVVGGRKLATGLTITATVTHADGTSVPPTVQLLDIVGGEASSISINFGAPVSQSAPAVAAAQDRRPAR